MVKTVLLFLTFMNLSLTAYAADELLPFRTDYCTGYAEGTFSDPHAWKHCCLSHDLFFWAGGTETERDKADLGLKACVEETGHALQAQIIYLAVRAGSRSPVKLPENKWNNGWPQRGDHQALSIEDIDRIEEQLLSQDDDTVSLPLKDSFLRELRSR